MRQYKHSIAKSKLIKMGLTAKQISRVYASKGTNQLKKAKNFQTSNSLVQAKQKRIKYLKSNIAEYNLLRQENKLKFFTKSPEFFKLSAKEQHKIEAKFFKIQADLIKVRYYKAPKQTKAELYASWLNKIQIVKARLNAGEKAHYLNRTRQENYEVNGTINTPKLEFLISHFPNEWELRINQGVPINQVVDELWELAIKTGVVKHLQQGAEYGYIDETYKEVISPV